MSATVTTTSTSVNPAEGIEVGLPRGGELEVARPWVKVPSNVYITMPPEADGEAAAAWWRQLAHNAALIARWYEHRAGGAR